MEKITELQKLHGNIFEIVMFVTLSKYQIAKGRLMREKYKFGQNYV